MAVQLMAEPNRRQLPYLINELRRGFEQAAKGMWLLLTVHHTRTAGQGELGQLGPQGSNRSPGQRPGTAAMLSVATRKPKSATARGVCRERCPGAVIADAPSDTTVGRVSVDIHLHDLVLPVDNASPKVLISIFPGDYCVDESGCALRVRVGFLRFTVGLASANDSNHWMICLQH